MSRVLKASIPTTDISKNVIAYQKQINNGDLGHRVNVHQVQEQTTNEDKMHNPKGHIAVRTVHDGRGRGCLRKRNSMG